VNTSFAVFNKFAGSVLYGPVAGNTLWQGFGGVCETTNDGDPIVQYDKSAQRWVLSQLSVTGGAYYECVAVSTTSDATGSYYRYAFPMPAFNDYPKMGVWSDAYYMSFNLFQDESGPFLGAYACALDRANMLVGATTRATVCFQLSSAYGGLLPSDLDGRTAPPSGSPDYFVNLGSNALNLWQFHVDFDTPANSTFTGPTSIPVAAFSLACNGGACVPQPNSFQILDSLGDRLMYRLAYRNFGDHESIVASHSVAAGNSVGVRWYEIRSPGGMPTVYQQGTFSPDSTYRWMGSIAMDSVSDIAVGYSASSSSVYPSIQYTGRVPTDPLNTMESENVLIAGAGSQQVSYRWGDYTSMSVDPNDDCTLWYTNEYLQSGSSNWSTRIGSFAFPNCSLQHIYTSGSGTETIPNTSFAFVDIEKWDGGADGGFGRPRPPPPIFISGGGGGGGYSVATYPITGHIGETISYSVGAGGRGRIGTTTRGMPGGITTVSSGTFTITAMGASSPASGGDIGIGGAGSVPTGGATNTNGNPGTSGGIGGAAIAGAQGNAYGAGGAEASPGANGAVIFYYHN
jgi:hypothetical protein